MQLIHVIQLHRPAYLSVLNFLIRHVIDIYLRLLCNDVIIYEQRVQGSHSCNWQFLYSCGAVHESGKYSSTERSSLNWPWRESIYPHVHTILARITAHHASFVSKWPYHASCRSKMGQYLFFFDLFMYWELLYVRDVQLEESWTAHEFLCRNYRRNEPKPETVINTSH